MDAPAGVTQEGLTRFLHLPSAVLASIFIASRIQPSLSLVDREVEFCEQYPRINRSPLVEYDCYLFIKAVVKFDHPRIPAFQPFMKPVSYFLRKQFHAVQCLYQL